MIRPASPPPPTSTRCWRPNPQCAVYTAMADNRLPDALEDYRRILAAGVNVVGSSAVFLQYPWQTLPGELVTPIEDAAKAGNASLFVNGIDPGFANDLLPLALAGTCQSIEQIRCMEIVDYDTYDSATVMFDVMGFGKPTRRAADAAAAGRAEPGVGFGGASARRGPRHRTRRGHRDLRPRARTRGLRHRVRPHRQGHRRRAAVRGAWNEGRQAPPSCSNTSRGLRDDLRPDWPQPAQEGGSYRVESHR